MAQPDVSIVILNYKVRDLVVRAVASVIRQTQGVSYEVVVVDNASNDGVGDAMRGQFPQVRVIENEQNLGFAGGCNVGIRVAAGRYVLLLNPDTELREDAITALVHFAEAHPKAGVVGPKITNPDGSWQPSVRAFPQWADQVSIMLKLHHVWRNMPWMRRYLCDGFDAARAQQVDQVIGAAFLMTPAARRMVPLLDERYFIWFEEVDYCKMVRNAGLEVWYTPETSVMHEGGQSFAQVFSARKQGYFNTSLSQYMRKHHGLLAWAGVWFFHPASMLLAWAIGVLKLRRKNYV